MGRSVSVPSGAVATSYIHLDEDLDPDFGWDDFVEDVQNVLKERYPSLTDEDKWVDREERAILDNAHCQIVIAEYCGLVSLSLVPKEFQSGYGDDAQRENIAKAWCDRVARGFTAYVNSRFTNSLVKLGSMSNGEGVYRRVGQA